MRHCFVQVNDQGRAIRIFKNRKRAREVNPDYVRVMPYADAARAIRQEIYGRQGFRCRKCPNLVTWESMHLDEMQARGEFDEQGRSGEISVDNCQGLCAECHIVGPRSEHGSRRPQWD